MTETLYGPLPISDNGNSHCLACGVALPGRKRRYCGRDCPETLHRALNRRTGLLRALNTQYATFYFNDTAAVLDVLPYGTPYLFSFVAPRSSAKKPVDNLCELSNLLGNVWWAEKNRTRKRYLASQHVLEKAQKKRSSRTAVRPRETVCPSVKKAFLKTLKIKKTDLHTQPVEDQIKRAYRRQAKRAHPDVGGDAAVFRKVQEAYEKLIAWAEAPSFIRHRGLPDRWFYDGRRNRWVYPT